MHSYETVSEKKKALYQWVKAHVTLAEDQGLIPRTDMIVHNYL